MKTAIGIYYVIGYGRDCDGYSKFDCTPYVDLVPALELCNMKNEWSDGVQYAVVTDMMQVRDYCDNYNRSIPLAILSEDDIIKRHHTYVLDPVFEIDDNDIEKASEELASSARIPFMVGAKWYREQLKKKQ
jgi:hypothetical protein